MAIYYPDGSMSGKLGNLIFFKVKGKTRVRSTAANFKQCNKVSQLYRTLSMSVVSSFTSKNSAILTIGYQASPRNHPVLEALSVIWKSALVLPDVKMDEKVTKKGKYPLPVLDYSKIAVSRGLISEPVFTAISRSGSTLTLEWPDTLPSPECRPEDQLTGLIWSEKGYSFPCYNIGSRHSGSGSVMIPQYLTDKLHAWFFWYNPYKNREENLANVSGSVYQEL